MTDAVGDETGERRPGPCAECKRLQQHAYAASVLHDWDWLGKTTAARRKHLREQHGAEVAA
jgi:hypothetical protein